MVRSRADSRPADFPNHVGFVRIVAEDRDGIAVKTAVHLLPHGLDTSVRGFGSAIGLDVRQISCIGSRCRRGAHEATPPLPQSRIEQIAKTIP